ncbi:MAG TPA: hypothetical protein VK545_09765 [Streptomyces sp.]|nr:hypothetical protein [Streptomyces sp.]
MSVTGVAQEIAAVAPWALVVLVVLVVVIRIAGGVLGLRIALRGTSEDARPRIIRALADFFKSLFWPRK